MPSLTESVGANSFIVMGADPESSVAILDARLHTFLQMGLNENVRANGIGRDC